jgi:hypothetical protein
MVFGARQRRGASAARRHRAGHRRHRRAEASAPDFLQPRRTAGATVLISDPSWENHRAPVRQAGFTVETYPYYDAATRGVDFDGHAAPRCAPRRPAPSSVLHACCHNPTGYDLTPDAVGSRWSHAVRRPGPGTPSSTWPTRASATASPKTARRCWPVPGRGPGLLRRHVVLQELLALRRAGGRAQRGLRLGRGGRARAVGS